jgi:two-component system cell cycle response regulator DivK
MSKRILYIEDAPDNRDLVTQMLSGLYEIETATNGDEGLDAARLRRPDLILMDVSLPVVDGLSCTRIIRRDPLLRDIPVIALTAHCMVGDREKALAAGCDGFLSKPFRLAELRSTIAEFLARAPVG